MKGREKQSLEPHLSNTLIPHPLLGPDYMLCQQTGVIYYTKAKHATDPDFYESDYFNSRYEAQYGHSYLQDETHLRRLARRRLSFLARYQKPSGKLLEIGSAMGFFLDEARSRGYNEVAGIETSQYASDYSHKTFNLEVITQNFLNYPNPPDDSKNKERDEKRFDAICCYYTLEHFPEQRKAFIKIAKLLKTGGILSLALPSSNGPLFNRHLKQWEASHPDDHFADYSPQSLAKVLPLYGLRILKAWPASYHPERWGKVWEAPPLHLLYRFYANSFTYGDTMEAIAIKVKDS